MKIFALKTFAILITVLGISSCQTSEVQEITGDISKVVKKVGDESVELAKEAGKKAEDLCENAKKKVKSEEQDC